MDLLLWVLIITSLLFFVFRRFVAGNSMPITRQFVRQLTLQRLIASCSDVHIIAESDAGFTVKIGEEVCEVRTEQLFLRCLEFPTSTRKLIRQAICAIEQALQETGTLSTDWERHVYPLLFPVTASVPPDALIKPVLPNLQAGYVFLNESFRWITQREVSEANIDPQHLHESAVRNLERSCNALVIDAPSLHDGDRERFIRFITGDGLDAARILLPSFYQRFSTRFGDTSLLVAIPSRDALAMVAFDDQALASMLAWRSGREFHERSYSLTPNLLLVNEQGLYPWPPV